MKRYLIHIALCALFLSAALGQTEAVKKDPGTNEITEDLVVPSGRTLTIDGTLEAGGLQFEFGLSGILLTNSYIGTEIQQYDADLDAHAALASTGLVARTGSGTQAVRTITGTSNQITVTNGNGVSGNPTLSLPSNAVLPGTNITAPSQTAASGSSLMTRSLGDVRYEPMAGGISSISTSATGVLLTGTVVNGQTRYRGEWAWSAAARASITLNPYFSIDGNRNGKFELFSYTSPVYSQLWHYYANGSASGIFVNAGAIGQMPNGANATLYPAVPYITVSGSLSVVAGDVITDGSGASAIASSTRTATDVQFRWISGTKWFTTGNTVAVNGTPSAVTVTGGLLTSAVADLLLVYEGSSDGTNYGATLWNNTASTMSGFVRVDR